MTTWLSFGCMFTDDTTASFINDVCYNSLHWVQKVPFISENIFFLNKSCYIYYTHIWNEHGKCIKSSKNFEGDGDETFGVKRPTPWKLIGFGPFVYCLWRIVILFFIFLSMSLFLLQFFFFLGILGGDVPLFSSKGSGGERWQDGQEHSSTHVAHH